ncbi:hypothetical protein [Streptomyces sp. ISL-11]|uniref:hypothetical protein n=1 Tax=Streptomyces sp. ISL-11 TaxID=2819174 RepID=UPI001BEAFBCA|nr:hypothetical protein [Streptomyces sp. ISL-11]MBT2382215.1 hypothetical protein [Streptomyces sp. ISL-11]
MSTPATARPATSTERAAAPAAPSGRSRRLNTLKWALLIPVLTVVAGCAAQYPYGMWLTIPLAFVTIGAAAIVAGSSWRRPGAATLACVAAFALLFFSGPALYDLYAKKLGEPLDAVVAQKGTHRNAKGTELDTCTVIDTDGGVHRLSQQQNCFGQFKEWEPVTLMKDPVGLLEPYLLARTERAPDTTGLGISAGLFALTGASMLYAGGRRRG